MITKEKIERINVLARKKKAEGLTEEEAKEQQALRAEYLQGIRANLKRQLDAIEIVDPNYEDSYTEEDKAHIAELSAKLGAEYAEKQKESTSTELKNPKKSLGEGEKK